MTLIYLHGFASDGGGWKARALQQFFPAANVVSPDLPADPTEVVAILEAIVRSASDTCYWFGTSLGGFYAYYAGCMFEQSAFLFNPSLRPDQTLRRGIGTWQTFQKQRTYHFAEAYLPKLAVLRQQARYNEVSERLYFFLSKDDTILDLRPIPHQFPSAAHISWYADCGHAFSKFEKVVKIIRREGWIGEKEETPTGK